MKIFIEMQCEHCKNTMMEQVVWIYFATSLKKTYKCPYCGELSTSNWMGISDCEAQTRLERTYEQKRKESNIPINL